MDDIIRLIKSLGESGLLIKVVSETIKNKAKEQKSGFLCILLGTLGSNSLGNISANTGSIATGAGKETIRAGEGKVRATRIFDTTEYFS